MLDTARKIRDKIQARGGDIPLPEDVVCATEFSAEAHAVVRKIDEVEDDEMILDIGPKSRAKLAAQLKNAGPVVWNGPVGVFEYDALAGGNRALAAAIADRNAFSLAGGGDHLSELDTFPDAATRRYSSPG